MNNKGARCENACREKREYIWREKVEGEGYEEHDLFTYGKEKLEQFRDFCIQMVSGTDFNRLGKENILKEVRKEIKNCNIQLFFRFFRRRFGYSEFQIQTTFREFINNNVENHPKVRDYPVSKVLMNGCPCDFKDVTIRELINAASDSLGQFTAFFSKKRIYKKGIYFTEAESKELKPNTEELIALGSSNGKVTRVGLVKYRLGIPMDTYIARNGKGLSYYQFRAMVQLPHTCKYSDLTLDQLYTLRDKVLPELELDLEKQVIQWKKRLSRIEEVMKEKGYME